MENISRPMLKRIDNYIGACAYCGEPHHIKNVIFHEYACLDDFGNPLRIIIGYLDDDLAYAIGRDLVCERCGKTLITISESINVTEEFRGVEEKKQCVKNALEFLRNILEHLQKTSRKISFGG